jgi:hypothetical protein
MTLEELLLELLTDLASVAEQHAEVNDSDVEEAMSKAVFDGFLKPVPGFSLPDSFGMYSAEGNGLVKAALVRYIEQAALLAANQALSFQQRLSAFQNRECTVGPAQLADKENFLFLPSVPVLPRLLFPWKVATLGLAKVLPFLAFARR